jgi:hypothetical protein
VDGAVGGVYAMQIGELKSTLRLHTWILSFNTALLAAVAVKLFGL